MSDENGRQSVEQQIQFLQAHAIAHSLVLKALIPALLHNSDARTMIRDNICKALEKMCESGGLRSEADFTLHAALAEVEDLFTLSSDLPSADEPTAE
jgi:hypothetical protein